ncbi:VanW family protein [Halalkalibacter urbisdiaboli]|uniref:VanW family protein n=1 Tax=Halalkalibacter urbisdiaboli TaxID=1960589 RepID=UPI000B44F091|nr:VanW family protein [Halalkalibacter urbisdiaboli]
MKPILIILLTFIPFLNLHDQAQITFEDKTITTVNRKDYIEPHLGRPVINHEKYTQLVENINVIVSKQPENAFINSQGDIEAEKVGYALDRKTFQTDFYQYFFGQGDATIAIKRQKIYPRVDTELLGNVRVKQIGSYITYFNTYNKERSHNISLASEAIDNFVVFPGETFSFNRVVGKRTTERGYLPAPVIVRGELTEGIGGGICQISSTLYNAVDRAGLKIIERYTHSRRVPYVPPGRDATVSWYGPDFIFKNPHNQPILIRSKTSGGQVVISIHSSENINYEPRKTPAAPKQLPKEIHLY